ncbi:MAG: aldolase catalytic domain-containing protein [Clostridiales bacterium]|nr:aldolase catalytic domain-containing protein [Clostridiales bacterium]
MSEISLLDCTLRDGGYINDWEFGHNNLLSIYERLVASGVEIVEVGFIDDRRPFDINRSIFPDTASIKKIYGSIQKKAPMTIAMIDYGTCDIKNIQPCSDSWIDGIRVIFKKHLMNEAMAYCAQLKALGYKVFSQLVSITSYDDQDLLKIARLVNEVEPYAVSMVDTYGLLTPNDLLRYYESLDKNVKQNVCIGFHAHNNMQLAYANALTFIQKSVKRNVVVDGTLHGMGKSAGNDPIELVANYMNEKLGKSYDIDQMLEAIEESVIDIYHKYPWDYKTFFYLSAKNKCHPNYVSYLQDKSNLSVSDLDKLLSKIKPDDNKLLYKKEIAGDLYNNYKTNVCDDSKALADLSDYLKNREVLIIGPGKNIELQRDRVSAFVSEKNPIRVSINYFPSKVKADLVFVTNGRRFLEMTETILDGENKNVKLLATSNITAKSQKFDFVVNREPLLERNENIIDNSFLMLLKVLKNANVKEVFCAGLDGYSDREDNYFNPKMEYSFVKNEAKKMNRHIRNVLQEMEKDMKINFITYSHYQVNEEME